MNIVPVLVAFGAVVSAAFLWQSVTSRRPRPRRRDSASHLMPYGPYHGVSSLGERRPIAYAAEGIASERFPSLAHVFLEVAAKHPSAVALRTEVAERPPQRVMGYTDITWAAYAAASRSFADALLRLGIRRYDAVVICGSNAPEWFYAHWGTILAGGVSVGVYTTSGAEACEFIVRDCSAVVAVVDSAVNAAKFAKVRERCPLLRRVVMWGGTPEGPDTVAFDAFLEGSGDDADANERLRAAVSQQSVEDPACLIYTSGTTGMPKGVMVSSDNMLFAAATANATWTFTSGEEHTVSYLPCSHVAAQVLDIALPLYLRRVGIGMVVYFARPDALRGSLSLTLRAVRPTFFFAVPRVWEKLVEGIKAAAAAAPPRGLRSAILAWAKRMSLWDCAARQLGGSGRRSLLMALPRRLVHRVVKQRLGLDRCPRFITGAAPIGTDTLTFLAALGIDVLELYGMSESTGIGTCSTGDCFRFGTCGAPYRGTASKIDHDPSRDNPGEGEVCYRGRHVMLGYLHCPDKTAEAIDKDGWLHSGDVGRLDEHGMLRITGRIKELIITAGGENIAPVPIEAELKRLVPAMSNAVVVGDRRKFNVVLVTLTTVTDPSGQPTDELAAEGKAVDPQATTLTRAALSRRWAEVLDEALARYNAGPVCVSNAARVQKAVVLPRDLSVAHGELTDTLKLRRSAIAANYATLIDALYA